MYIWGILDSSPQIPVPVQAICFKCVLFSSSHKKRALFKQIVSTQIAPGTSDTDIIKKNEQKHWSPEPLQLLLDVSHKYNCYCIWPTLYKLDLPPKEVL